MSEKIKNNPIIGAAISYLETNADKLSGKDFKTTFKMVQTAAAKAIKNKK